MRLTLLVWLLVPFASTCTPTSTYDDDSTTDRSVYVRITNSTGYPLVEVRNGPCDGSYTEDHGELPVDATITWSADAGCLDVLVIDIDSWWAQQRVDLAEGATFDWIVMDEDMGEPEWWD